MMNTTSWETVLHNMTDGRRKVINVHYVKIEESTVLISVEYKTTSDLYTMTYEDAVELNIYHKYLPEDIVEQLTKSNSVEEYDEVDLVDVQAMLDDEEELNAIARYEATHTDNLKVSISNLESAAESVNGVFGCVAQAVKPLINKIEEMCDPYLNMMYEPDYEWYDSYINTLADMYAAA